MEQEQLKNQLATIQSCASELIITSQPDYDRAGAILKVIKGQKKIVDDTFGPMVEAAHKAHKAVKEQQNKFTEPLKELEGLVKSKMATYQTEIERQKRLELEAKLKAEAEERARIEEERLRQEAEIAKEWGANVEAEKLEKQALQAAETVIVEPIREKIVTGVKADNTFVREIWDYEIIDVNIIPKEFLTIDHKAIKAFVTAKKQDAKIDGVRVFSTKTIGVR